MSPKTRTRWIWFAATVALFAVGIVVGLILESVWLGLLFATLVSLVWLIGLESRKSGNAGVNDESRGIEL